MICGAGHDAIPLVRAAAGIGWRPVVVDDRPAFLTTDRYPEAHAFVPLEEPGQVAEAAPLRRGDVRRGDDPQLLSRSRLPPGAAAVRRRLYRDAWTGGPHAADPDGPREDGVEITDKDRARIHGPAGLDLGAEGPDEIAQAIVAEIIAVRHDRAGGFLKERPGPIHDRPRPGTEAR